MNKCQYTGIELQSKRAKNCAEVTALLNDAQRAGKYGQVVDAMNDAKRAGTTGLAVVEIGRNALKYGYTSQRDREYSRSMTDIMENGD